jgi:hypothetical protein
MKRARRGEESMRTLWDCYAPREEEQHYRREKGFFMASLPGLMGCGYLRLWLS